MALQTNTAVRSFSYNGAELPDPNPALSLEEVKGIFSAAYPELTNATIDGPNLKGNRLQYIFVRTAGAKG
jgi:PRTRC genetic system protein C